MAEIVLSSAVRNNLLSLQKTARLMGQTQERLATGLKVNTALDDPTAFFTASGLNSRAGDLNRLLDSVGNAIQTLRAADQGITAITKLVESAQATARQALQQPDGSLDGTIATAKKVLPDDAPATVTGTSVTGDPDMTTLGVSDGDTFTVDVDGTAVTFEFDIAGDGVGGGNSALAAGGGGTLLSAVVGEINTALTNATVSDADTGADTQIQIKADGNTGPIVITDGTGTPLAALGLAAGTTNPTNPLISSLSETMVVQVNDDPAETFDLSGYTTKAAFTTALESAFTNVTATVNANGRIELQAPNSKDEITITGGKDVGFKEGTVQKAHNTTRESLEGQFNLLLDQLDELAFDANYNGNNLLDGDNLKVIFNEDNTSFLTIDGVVFDSNGLGLTSVNEGEFQTDTGVNSKLSELDTAIRSLRQQASNFGSNLTVVEVRQDFTKGLINTLETGAANLTIADTNEEGANLLALQTRQQLSSTALSLASQAEQNVLRLFG